MRSQRAPWRTFSAILASIGAVIAVGIAATGLIREAQRRRAVDREIRAIEAEIVALDARRTRLTEVLTHAESPEFLEQEARLRLGLQKPGETVLIVRPPGGGSTAQPGAPRLSIRESNARKWWWRIFGE